MARKVAVTGLGIVSPLGCRVDTVWNRLLNGESGIGPITYFDTTLFDAKIAGQVKEFDVDAFIPKKEQRRMDPFCHYGIAAAKMAVSDSGLDMAKEDPWRVGVVVSSGIGGFQVVEVQCNNFLQKGPSRFSPS